MAELIQFKQCCSGCYKFMTEPDFTRKNKIYGSCNTCALTASIKNKLRIITPAKTESIKSYNANYYLLNKERLDARPSKKVCIPITCECGKTIMNYSIYMHVNCHRHREYVESKQTTL